MKVIKKNKFVGDKDCWEVASAQTAKASCSGETIENAHKLGLIFFPQVHVQNAVFFTFIEIAVSQTVFLAMVAKTKLHCLTHLSSLGLFLGRGRRWCVRFGIPFFGRGFPCCLSLRFPFSLRFGFRFHFHSFGHQPWYWKSIPTKVLPT